MTPSLNTGDDDDEKPPSWWSVFALIAVAFGLGWLTCRIFGWYPWPTTHQLRDYGLIGWLAPAWFGVIVFGIDRVQRWRKRR